MAWNASAVIITTVIAVFAWNGCGGEGKTCQPSTCEQLGKECGSWDDGCGVSLDCGVCTGGTCSQAGVCKAGAGCQSPVGVPCCDGGGSRLGSAECRNDAWVCEVGGSLCTCAEVEVSFVCADFCGSDVFLDPECAEAGWACPFGLIATDTCPADTCWFEPMPCCDDSTGDQVATLCEDGAWTCPEGASWCEG
jgi:hypothetical protein